MLKKHKTNATAWLGFDIMKYPTYCSYGDYSIQ